MQAENARYCTSRILPLQLKESPLERLYDIALRDGGYVLALVEVYFDESGTHDDSRFLCVAGYIFEKQKAIDLDYEWRLMLKDYGLPYFHMKACTHPQKGIYAHLNAAECDDAARRAIGLIKKYAERGIAISIDIQAFPMIPLFGKPHTPYTFACTQVVHGIQKWANATEFQGDVAYFFETGAAGRGFVVEVLDDIVSFPDLKAQFHHESHTFIGKEQATPLQCADMLAWHWYTHNKRRAKGEPMRKDFRNLSEMSMDVHHYDKESITQWMRADAELRGLLKKTKPA